MKPKASTWYAISNMRSKVYHKIFEHRRSEYGTYYSVTLCGLDGRVYDLFTFNPDNNIVSKDLIPFRNPCKRCFPKQ